MELAGSWIMWPEVEVTGAGVEEEGREDEGAKKRGTRRSSRLRRGRSGGRVRRRGWKHVKGSLKALNESK